MQNDFVDGGLNLSISAGGCACPDSSTPQSSGQRGGCEAGVNVSGIVGRDGLEAAIREWIGGAASRGPAEGHGWTLASRRPWGPRREWLDAITGERPMYLLSADGHDAWFNTAAMRAAGIGPDTPDPNPDAQYWVRDPDGTPSGHAVEPAATMPILVALGLTSPDSVRAAQDLTLWPAPSWGITAYFDAGVFLGATAESGRWVFEDLIAGTR